MPQSKGRFSLCSRHLLWVLGQVEVVVWIIFSWIIYAKVCVTSDVCLLKILLSLPDVADELKRISHSDILWFPEILIDIKQILPGWWFFLIHHFYIW